MDELRPDHNPYSTPSAPLVHPAPARATRPAARWKRLVAYLLDVAILFACVVPAGLSGDRAVDGDPSAAATLISMALLLALLVVDLVLLARHGQTLGKRLLGIRIVAGNGAQAGLGSVFGIRYLLNNVIGIVPFYALVDVLFIFFEDRRCVHDRLADTRVVDA